MYRSKEDAEKAKKRLEREHEEQQQEHRNQQQQQKEFWEEKQSRQDGKKNDISRKNRNRRNQTEHPILAIYLFATHQYRPNNL